VPTLTIDNTTLSFEPGETILQVATRGGIAIPTLCHLEGIEAPTSCFVCVVKIQGRTSLAPACATMAEEGMRVESETKEVRTYRKRALELLLSEHAGDCEAPCRRICPADLDIPVMAKQIVDGNLAAAACTVRERLALPGVLGYICPAPCQKGCVRASLDGAVSIRELHKGVAETVYASGCDWWPRAQPVSGKRVTILGAGPAGLSSAYYLSLLGHHCTVIDEHEEPGGQLRYGCTRMALPLRILEQEIEVIRALGVEFQMGCKISDAPALDELLHRSDALLLAIGTLGSEEPWPFALPVTSKGIAVDVKTFATDRHGVFACGNAITASRLAVRSVGHGRLAALSIHAFLTSAPNSQTFSPRFDSRITKLDSDELRQLVSTDLASLPLESRTAGPFGLPLVESASRCLQCDCGKKEACALRVHAQAYEADRDHYRTGKRKSVTRKRYASGLVHEPGKCIDCGRCIGITATEHAQPGLAFNNRGFDVAVNAPFHADMDVAMGPVLKRCIEACPVGALWDGE
jgi:ferredoxin